MSNLKRPVYLVVKPLGFMVKDEEGLEVEAVTILEIKQTRLGADAIQAKNPGSVVRKSFVTT